MTMLSDQIRGAFRIEYAKNSQTEEIKALIFKILAEYNLKSDAKTDADLQNIEQHYFQRGGFFAVIKNKDDKIIGTFGLMPISLKTAEIRKMYLMQDFRGKGLGKWMMTHLIDFAKSKGYKRLELETASNLLEAIQLYKKMGFKQHNPSELSLRCDSGYYLNI